MADDTTSVPPGTRVKVRAAQMGEPGKVIVVLGPSAHVQSAYERRVGDGRRSYFCPEIAEDILALFAGGATVELAASMVGITGNTIHEWVSKGKKAELAIEHGLVVEDISGRPATEYIDFSRKMRQAMALPEARALAQLSEQGDSDWRAAESYLRLRYRQRYDSRVAPQEAIDLTMLTELLSAWAKCWLSDANYEEAMMDLATRLGAVV